MLDDGECAPPNGGSAEAGAAEAGALDDGERAPPGGTLTIPKASSCTRTLAYARST